MSIQKPVAIDEKKMRIVDAEGFGVCTPWVKHEAAQIVRELNAFDDLLAACKAAMETIDAYFDCEAFIGTKIFETQVILRDAISKAEAKQ